MALTSGSFVPEQRYNADTDMASPPAPQESVPAVHPLTGTQIPQDTGAGKGNVNKGLVRGK
jgi:hypothetical protein